MWCPPSLQRGFTALHMAAADGRPAAAAALLAAGADTWAVARDAPAAAEEEGCGAALLPIDMGGGWSVEDRRETVRLLYWGMARAAAAEGGQADEAQAVASGDEAAAARAVRRAARLLEGEEAERRRPPVCRRWLADGGAMVPADEHKEDWGWHPCHAEAERRGPSSPTLPAPLATTLVQCRLG